MEFFIPLLIIGFLALLAIGFLFARRDTGKGPHPDQTPSTQE